MKYLKYIPKNIHQVVGVVFVSVDAPHRYIEISLWHWRIYLNLLHILLNGYKIVIQGWKSFIGSWLMTMVLKIVTPNNKIKWYNWKWWNVFYIFNLIIYICNEGYNWKIVIKPLMGPL
jgi:hypothetical protein